MKGIWREKVIGQRGKDKQGQKKWFGSKMLRLILSMGGGWFQTFFPDIHSQSL